MANYIKVRMDKTQQNSKGSIYSNRDETMDYIISEWNKLALKAQKT